MPKPLLSGSQLTCSFGLEPATFTVEPSDTRPKYNGVLLGVQTDSVFETNIPNFGKCISPLNPQFVATKTPQPCLPKALSGWFNCKLMMTWNGLPFAQENSTCVCNYLGCISSAKPTELNLDLE
ncbi:MAG: DUF4280 domain-containing protein [Acetobacter sp.]